MQTKSTTEVNTALETFYYLQKTENELEPTSKTIYNNNGRTSTLDHVNINEISTFEIVTVQKQALFGPFNFQWREEIGKNFKN